MTTSNIDIKQHWERHEQEFITKFKEFLAFPSVSSEAEFSNDVRSCASWLAHELVQIGLHVETWETPGHPVIFAETKHTDPLKPTVLLYNHYDVQPVDPLSAWSHPPFEAHEESGEIFARGAQDNKGQCFYVFSALHALLHSATSSPVNIKWLIEGEEEIGSPNLPSLLNESEERLRADALFIVDVGLHDLAKPSVTLGLRGIVTITVRVIGSDRDLHSGSHGGIVYNPNRALVEILAKCKTAEGRVTIPGFYDDVLELSEHDLAKICFDFDHAEYQRLFGAVASGTERPFLPFQSAWIRPSLEINGIAGGYAGEGFKTVIPAHATAKLSCRLVPNQDPRKIGEAIATFLKSNAPPGIRVEVDVHPGSGRAVRTPASSPMVKAVAEAYTETLGAPCKFIFEGATIPIVAELQKACGGDVVLFGFGLPDDNIHAPNEHFSIHRLKLGYLTLLRSLELIGKPQA